MAAVDDCKPGTSVNFCEDDQHKQAALLLAQLNRQRLHGNFCDITVVVNNTEFHAHCCILAASSPKMQSMIFSVREVCSDSTLVIDSIATAGFKVILDFIYTGKYQFEPVLYHDVLEAARYLGMTEFENICRENVVEPGNNFSNSHEVESKCVMPDFAPIMGLKEIDFEGTDSFQSQTSYDDDHESQEKAENDDRECQEKAENGDQEYQENYNNDSQNTRIPMGFHECLRLIELHQKKKKSTRFNRTNSSSIQQHFAESKDLPSLIPIDEQMFFDATCWKDSCTSREQCNSARSNNSFVSSLGQESCDIELKIEPESPFEYEDVGLNTEEHGIPFQESNDGIENEIASQKKNYETEEKYLDQTKKRCKVSTANDLKIKINLKGVRKKGTKSKVGIANKTAIDKEYYQFEDSKIGTDILPFTVAGGISPLGGAKKKGKPMKLRSSSLSRSNLSIIEEIKEESDETFTGINKLTDEPDMPFECALCCKRFKRASELGRHERGHSKQMFQCRTCLLEFSNVVEFKRHCKGVHGIHHPFVCLHPDCNYRSDRLSCLEKHSSIHSSVKLYTCMFCGKSFAQDNGLRSHLLSCTQAQSYMCDLCGAKFNHLQSMQSHRRTHTGEKPYQCTDCGSQFADHRNFKRHRRIHENIFPYHCSVCDKKFRHSNSLKAHTCIPA